MNNSDKQQRNLYVWGENFLLNQLLASEIERISNVSVFTINHVTLPLEEFLKVGDNHLIFCDCLQGDVHQTCRLLHQLAKHALGEVHFVLVNVKNSDQLSHEISRLNVDGVFYFNDSLEVLHKGVQALLAGEIWLSRALMSQTLLCVRDSGPPDDDDAANVLTKREKEILQHLSSGISNQEIADILYISTNTVKTHVSNIYAKIDVSNRVQAILWAAKFFTA